MKNSLRHSYWKQLLAKLIALPASRVQYFTNPARTVFLQLLRNILKNNFWKDGQIYPWSLPSSVSHICHKNNRVSFRRFKGNARILETKSFLKPLELIFWHFYEQKFFLISKFWSHFENFVKPELQLAVKYSGPTFPHFSQEKVVGVNDKTVSSKTWSFQSLSFDQTCYFRFKSFRVIVKIWKKQKLPWNLSFPLFDKKKSAWCWSLTVVDTILASSVTFG